jgi:hypothetical protein
MEPQIPSRDLAHKTCEVTLLRLPNRLVKDSLLLQRI